jgi:radical SAM superfamily enzyme YgiQ (UPF0313 family)
MTVYKENILFIIPSFFYIGDYQKRLYFNDIPLGTLQLSSLLREQAKVKPSIIDLRIESEKYGDLSAELPNNNAFKEALLKVLEQHNIQEFQNIGITCYTSYHYLQTDLIANIVKEEFSKINIIVGGYHPTALAKDFMYENSPYNYIIQGEADLPLLKLFQSGKLNKSNAKANRIITPSGECIDVNLLPFPDYSLYLEQYPFTDKFNLDFYMSRGCPYQCAFCAENYEFRSYNFESFQRNFDQLCEIVEEYNKKAPKIRFADQSFNRVSISKQVLDYIIQNDLPERISFSCQSRIEIMANKLELIDKFKKSRMIVGYGLETVSNILLKEMHKTENPQNYIKIVREIINKYKDDGDIYCRLNTLVGFPGETHETLKETVDFINSSAIHPNIQISPTFFSNYPNVFVYKNMDYYEKKFGSEFIKEWWKLPSNSFKNSIPTRPSKNYSLKQMISDYKDLYISILKEFKRDTFAHLVYWKSFFNNWYKELN